MDLLRHVGAARAAEFLGPSEANVAMDSEQLRAAVDQALAEQGVGSVEQLTYDKHNDDIRSTTAGVIGVRDIDWQNRPTFQQVVGFPGHRPRR